MLWMLGLASFAANAYVAYKKGEISEEEYRQAMSSNDELERKLKSLRPDETWENIDPTLLQTAAKYSPDIAAFVQENAPELITEAKSATEKRVQREALQKYSQMAETGRDVVAEAQREQALFEADARAKQRQQRLMEGLKRQGMLGSGAGLAAQLQTEQQERQAAREESIRGVQEAEARRRQALSQAATLAGQMRGENLQVESANVNTMNSFNQRLANAKNLYNQYASEERNKAQALNQQREMERNKYNLELGNKYAMYNREQALAAREKARQFDVGLTEKMHGLRSDAQSNKYKADRQFMADMGSAVTSGIGVGLSGASLDLKGADGVKNAIAQGVAEGATSTLTGGPQDYVSQSSQTGNLYQSLYPYQQPIDNTPSYSGPLRPPQRSEFVPANLDDIEISSNIPKPQSYDWRDQPEALDEYGREDYQRMKARTRRNTGGGY